MDIMQLEEFFGYKDRLMKDLLTNEEIVNLLDEDVPIENAKSLAYSRVFPFEYVPDTVEHGDTYICFDVDIQEVFNKTFLSPTLYIWVLRIEANFVFRLAVYGLINCV